MDAVFALRLGGSVDVVCRGVSQRQRGMALPYTPANRQAHRLVRCSVAIMFSGGMNCFAKKRFSPRAIYKCSALQSGGNDNVKGLLGFRASPQR